MCGHFGPPATDHVTRSMLSKLLAFNIENCNLRLCISVTVQYRRLVRIDNQ